MTNILVTTLGGTWQIMPELMGLTNPDLLDLFKHHPRAEKIEQERKKYGISPVDELWMVTTCGGITEKGLKKALDWYERVDKKKRPLLRIWQVSDTDNLATEDECRRMCEAIHTIVFNARHCSENGKLYLSLTGGRKTMSTDLQNAAAWFGCNAVIHVVENSDYSKNIKVPENVEYFLEPIKPEDRVLITPFIIGKYEANPIISIARSGSSRLSISIDQYSIPCSLLDESPIKPIRLDVAPSFPLTTTLEKLQADAGYLMCNYTNTMLQGESQTNFLALYSLPEQDIKALKSSKMGIDPAKEESELSFLKKLPKTDLHCHLGGVANVRDLIRIASKASNDINRYSNLLETWSMRIKSAIIGRDASLIKQEIGSLKKIRDAVPNVPAHICTAFFIMMFQHDPELLEQVIYGQYLNESRFCSIGFTSYEQLGDLQGTGLLKHPLCLEEACRVIAEDAIEHNVLYLELRCSPVNYSSETMSAYRVYEIIRSSLSEYQDRLRCSIIFIASRHSSIEYVTSHVELACKILKQEESSDLKVRLRGFDLAGDEKACRASDMQPYLMPVMERCLHFTIHAGENQPVRSIWEAAYHLNAERIGHCLTLNENPELMERFLDRNIVLEMCPSSNFQIIGYRDNYYATTNHLKIYPLKQYFDKGLRVTVNTDNPGISRTYFSRELHRACRLTPDGLSRWEILSIIRNSFKASFAPRAVRHLILREAEKRIVKFLINDVII